MIQRDHRKGFREVKKMEAPLTAFASVPWPVGDAPALHLSDEVVWQVSGNRDSINSLHFIPVCVSKCKQL